jgi:putative hemolysin
VAAFLDVLIVLLLVGLSGLLVAIEVSVIASGRHHWDPDDARPDRWIRLAQRLAQSPRGLLISVRLLTLWIGTTGVFWAALRLLGPLAELFPDSDGLGWFAALVLLAFVMAAAIVIFREILPRPVARRHGRALTRFGVVLLSWVEWVFRPVVLLLSGVSRLILWILGSRGDLPTVTLEDLEGLIRAVAGEGLVDATEGRVALAALRLGDRTARDCMRPRTEVDALDIGTSVEEAFGMMAMSIYSRFPVYEDHLDHVQGYVHIKDVMKHYHLRLRTPLRQLARDVVFVPETLPLDKLLVALQEKRSHLAIVLDEFGGTLGVVGPQDILNELVGEFRPDHRVGPKLHEEPIRRDGPDGWLMEGSVTLDALCQHLRIRLAPNERKTATLGGLIQSRLDRVPRLGDTLVWHGWEFEVLRMDPLKPRKVDRVRVRKAEPEPNALDVAESNGTPDMQPEPDQASAPGDRPEE